MPKLQKLPDEINGFKIIKDLGFLCSSNAKQKFRACIAICPKCYKEFQSRPPCDIKCCGTRLYYAEYR